MSYDKFINSQFYKRRSKNLLKLGFDFNSTNPQKEYFKIQSLLYTDYHIHMKSTIMIQQEYGIPSNKTINDVFRLFDIESRTLSTAVSLGVQEHRVNSPTNFKHKHGWHTTWDSKLVYLRSSYEFKYAQSLDEQKIPYDVECIRIKYFCTQQNKYRIAIPDFYLYTTNEIVEVKSDYTYDKINMDDKFKAYLAFGFIPKLVKW